MIGNDEGSGDKEDQEPELRKVNKLRAFSTFISQPKYLGIILFVILILVNVVYFIGYTKIPTLIIADAEFAVASVALVGVVQKNER